MLDSEQKSKERRAKVGFGQMVAVRLGNSKDTYYIIGEFWQIVARLKASHARFRFRSRRWRWPGSLSELKGTMQPFPVVSASLQEAQQLQLAYDRDHIQPIQEWIKAYRGLVQDSVEWWAATRLKARNKDNPRSQKLYTAHQERVATALEVVDLAPAELGRTEILALEQTERLVKQYESRIVKWAAERAKQQRREQVLQRFEDEMGLSRENLLEIETSQPASRQALYEELAGLDWMPHEINELKATAKFLLRQLTKERKAQLVS